MPDVSLPYFVTKADNIDESDTREYQTDTDNVVGSTELPSSQTEKGELNAESVADKSADASTEIENATHQTPHASGDGQIVIDGQKATADRENVTDDKDSVTLKVTETSDDDKQESVGEGGDDHEESAEDDKEKDGKVRDEGDETADDNDEMQGRDEKVQDKDGKDPINDGKDTIVSQDRADYGDDTHDDKDAGDKEKEDSGGKAVDDSDKDENDDTAQTTIQGSDYKEMMDVYDIVVESDRDLTFEEAMRVRQSDRWDTLRSPQQKVVKKAYISSRQEEAKGSALKYSVLQSRDDVIGQSPVDPSQTRVVYANPDLGSELSKENGKYAACEQANMYIVVKDKNGDRVTDGSQSWTVDLRGPAILTPEVRYLENGVYQITFTPFTPGAHATINPNDLLETCTQRHLQRLAGYTYG
ncbi:hypothetical protein SARC_10310 [Sphaeroforma arctica JP610]|uniref:Uncharacterized protein n=1 Tax=Sphaeroforma arctica JP610 TaxID=667725 RepID=A0A0L0FKC5_9EUKA|nr:hypothetical protein SARC_10310 [Sphaeroforma arctica JP610]KNC77227.1 hypothetical protein SARC_10310 [Sphaeroforma arctica JP610]|eukprot:XP_014151129.1 hypothetical protein SARC_10310 [Sphaeroforma arctica JP610]